MRDLSADVASKAAITEVLHRYCRAVDRGDWELLRSVYHDDAIERHGPFTGGPEEFIAYVKSYMSDTTLIRQHHLTTINITIDGDVAYSETYFMCPTLLAPDQSGLQRVRELLGRYVDRLECRAGEWRLSERVAVVDLLRYQEAAVEPMLDDFARGTMDGSDPSYWVGVSATTPVASR
jgi:ketosteroid isomerase-like protein